MAAFARGGEVVVVVVVVELNFTDNYFENLCLIIFVFAYIHMCSEEVMR